MSMTGALLDRRLGRGPRRCSLQMFGSRIHEQFEVGLLGLWYPIRALDGMRLGTAFFGYRAAIERGTTLRLIKIKVTVYLTIPDY